MEDGGLLDILTQRWIFNSTFSQAKWAGSRGKCRYGNLFLVRRAGENENFIAGFTKWRASVVKVPLIMSIWAADERILLDRLKKVVFLDLLTGVQHVENNHCPAEN